MSVSELKESGFWQAIFPADAVILLRPSKVEVFRITPEDSKDWFNTPGKELDKEFGARLSAVLLDDGTYNWHDDTPGRTKCIFEPGLAYRFRQGKESASVVVCFKCSEVLFVSAKIATADPFQHPVRARLHPEVVHLTKQAFPHDQQIQTIKD